jgi:hypothetical protein
MSSAARTQPESVQSEAVVSVRGDSLREARTGLVLSLCLIAALAALHPDWKTLGTLAVLQSAATVYAAVRAVLKFRTRLDEAEPLPTRAVEAFGRPKPPPLGWKQRLSSWAILIAAIAGAVASLWTHWARDVMAAAIALLIADGLVRPLATAYLAGRWERTHGRLFRPFVLERDDEEPLYVADRPVPAA